MTGHHRIDGRPTQGRGSGYEPVDPRTGQPTGHTYPEARAEEITAAVDVAVGAAPVLRVHTSHARAAFLERLRGALDRASERLVALADVETGLGRPTLHEELNDLLARLDVLVDAVADGADVDARIDTASGTRSWRTALGPVALLGSDDSPFVFGAAGVDVASALAAGAPVVSRASPAHPGTAQALAAIVDQAVTAAGWPAGAHGLLHGRRPTLAEELVAAPGIEAVGHVGLAVAGRTLFDMAVARPDPIPFLGGFDAASAVIVRPGAARSERSRVTRVVADGVLAQGARWVVRPAVVCVPDDADGEWLTDDIGRALRRAPRRWLRTAARNAAFNEGIAARLDVSGVTSLNERVVDTSPGFAQEPVLLGVGVDDFLAAPALARPLPGPLLLVVRCPQRRTDELLAALDGCLLVTVLTGHDDDAAGTARLVAAAGTRAGRVVVDGPIALPAPADLLAVHAGPWPASVGGMWSGLGDGVIARWQRRVALGGVPDAALPPWLADANPHDIVRTVDGVRTRSPVTPGSPVGVSPAPGAAT